jgi:ribosomal protein S18 acetylase RimI-like enzyme
MDHYSIQNSVVNDLDMIYWLFEQAAVYQLENNVPDWSAYDKQVLQKDVQEKRHFKILSEDRIACIFSVLFSDGLIWREKEKGDAIYLHRIVVHPAYRGRRLFNKIFDWAVETSREKRLNYIRMDTWAGNQKLIDYYKGFGFRFIENFRTPSTSALPVQNRNLELALLEVSL